MSVETPIAKRLGRTLALLSAVGAIGWYLNGQDLLRTLLTLNESWLESGMIALHRSLDPESRDAAYFLELGVPAVMRLLLSLASLGMVMGFTSWWARMKDLWDQRGAAQDLAALRIVVFAALALYVSPSEIARFASLPPDLLKPPLGWDWLIGPWSPPAALMLVLAWLVKLAALAAAIGYRPRLSAWSAVGLGVVCLAMPQFYGKVNHYHHLIWFAAILAAAPAWDVWVPKWVATPNGGSRSTAVSRGYAAPLRWVWVLIGLIYFFPGFWKFVVAGPEWFDGSALATMIHQQWYRMGEVSSLRVDRFPLSALLGSGVLVFEIGFLFALPFARYRAFFVWGALAFHFGVFVVAGINFWSMAVCLVAFVPVARLFGIKDPLFGSDDGDAPGGDGAIGGAAGPSRPATLARPADAAGPSSTVRPADGAGPSSTVRPADAAGPSSTARPAGPRRTAHTSQVGGALVGAAIIAGFLGIDTWPFAVYPTFAGVADPYYSTLVMELDGGERIDPYRSQELREAFGQSRIMGIAWQVTRSSDDGARARAAIEALGAYDQRIATSDTVRAYEIHLDIRPGRWETIRERLRAEVMR